MGRLLDEQMVLARLHKYFANGFAEDGWWNSTHVLTAINETPSAEPQIMRCKDCKHWKDSDGVYRRGFGAESKCPINLQSVFDGTFYCGMAERRQDG